MYLKGYSVMMSFISFTSCHFMSCHVASYSFKILRCSRWFCNPPPLSFKTLYCFICVAEGWLLPDIGLFVLFLNVVTDKRCVLNDKRSFISVGIALVTFNYEATWWTSESPRAHVAKFYGRLRLIRGV